MHRLEINKNRSGFILDEKPFFYLGDTIWSAFTNVAPKEWEYYLKKRKQQGFTVLQINTLPQWDRCMSDRGIYPFDTEDGQKFDFTRWNNGYYENARKMCKKAVDMGFQLALVVLWLNYVPGTWGSKVIDVNVMPEGFLREYAERVVAEFDEFNPIYVISGDTDFRTPEAISYYRTILHTVCEKSPNSLKTMHICRGYDYIPEDFLDKLDFYMYQSGHNRDQQDMAYILPQNFMRKYPKKPLINAEPCYEQMGYSRKIYGRFQAEDLRKAAWNSILAGASAGVTYGAHGIWNWQKENAQENTVFGEGFDTASPWQEAIQYPGAWDYGWICHFFHEQKIQELIPANELLKNETDEIRVAGSPDGRYFIYLPHSTKVVLGKELTDYTVRAIDLVTRRIAYVDQHSENGCTIIEMHPFPGDALLVMEL